MKRKRLIATVVLILVVGFGAMLYGTSQGNAQKAPDFTLQDIDGNPVTLSDFEGKVIILDFWATWCGPCRMEIPGFVDLQDRYADDVVIVGVSLDQGGPADVVPFAKEYNINYPVVYGNGNVVQQWGGIRGIPTTFVIDRDFRVQRKYVGYQSHTVFEKDIQDLM